MPKVISDKTYTISGTSRDPETNIRTYRFANSKLNVRVNMLKHFKHTAIKLIELPKAMTKTQAMAWLIGQGIHAKLPTRAVNKQKKSPILLKAEMLAGKSAKIKASKQAKNAIVTTAPAAAPVEASPAS